MITYRFEEELQYAMHYAKKLGEVSTLEILEKNEISSSQEAKVLSEFFWKMVDSSIEDEKEGAELPWTENAEFWNKKLMNSFSGYLEKVGYEKEWDEVFDRQ